MLVERIKMNFNKRVQYKSKNIMYDVIPQDNIQQIANYLQDKTDRLQFNIPEIQIDRDADLDTRDYILKMTPEQRKSLGINKSRLSYMQKNIREGKRIKIYDKVKCKINSNST